MRDGRRGFGVVVLLGLMVLVLAPWSSVQGDASDEKAMKKKMQGWSRELGVKCSYCHVQQGRTYDYEAETPKKQIAHACEEKFVKRLLLKEGNRPVSCVDCHERKPRFFPRDGQEAAPPAAGDEGDGE